jgi:hypothetical protein
VGRHEVDAGRDAVLQAAVHQRPAAAAAATAAQVERCHSTVCCRQPYISGLQETRAAESQNPPRVDASNGCDSHAVSKQEPVVRSAILTDYDYDL